jgi:hypothetical protein
MKIARHIPDGRVTLGIGFVAGIAMMFTLAPAPMPMIPSPRTYPQNLSSVRLPSELDFCGEQVPISDPDIRKRMEREMLLNLQSDGQILLYLKRSGEIFPLYDSILKAEGVPSDLRFVSVAESALFQAQSAKGAIGLWQFMPETARRYGLRVDDYVDERRDPVKATHAAARMLKDDYQRFGSWAMSAAAYNMGEAGAGDDMTFQNGRSYYDLYLNEETSRYLFRIVAIKEIMTHPDKYGFYMEDADYYHAPPSATVEVAQDIPNLAQWAAEHGASYKDVKLLNPWIMKRSLPRPPANRPYRIAIPAKS